jgi:ADP-ribosylglycohydrolase
MIAMKKPATSRFIGCMVGGAIGDALGYPVEFAKSENEIQRVLGAAAPTHLPLAKSGKALVSDDTQMTLFTAEGLLRAYQRGVDRGVCSNEVVLLRAYHRWLSTQGRAVSDGHWQDPNQRGWLIDVPELHAARAPGNTCLSALSESLTRGGGPYGSVSDPPNNSKGCGAIMRSAPIGLAATSIEEAFDLSRDAAVLTHGHPSGYLAAAYFAAVIFEIARDVELAGALDHADELLAKQPDHLETRRAVIHARDVAGSSTKATREELESLGQGWVAEESLAIAVYCALTASRDHVADALYVSVAHAGDSDSTGSMTGNLLGAMWGLEVFPAAWIEDVELRETTEQLARDLHDTFVDGKRPDEKRYPPN